ncbi:hypothetical protein DRO69_02790 [Candidatus Bathyarchaeota archaeon]|nr:MAG: hypothetical protein DRO69_02790 [Candidatus Bathyarchaeota archaeon]
MKNPTPLNEIARKVRDLTTEYRDYAEIHCDGTAAGWHLMILKELQELKSEIESVQIRLDDVQRQLGELNEKLDSIKIEKDGQSSKTDLMEEIEIKFGESIEELLAEHKGESLREIADKLGVSKSTISNWLRKE